MRTHAWENERFGAVRLKPATHGANDLGQAGDATTAGRNRDAAIAKRLRREPQSGKPFSYFRFQVLNSPNAGRSLFQVSETRERNVSVA